MYFGTINTGSRNDALSAESSWFALATCDVIFHTMSCAHCYYLNWEIQELNPNQYLGHLMKLCLW